jgi:hypothetical protein
VGENPKKGWGKAEKKGKKWRFPWDFQIMIGGLWDDYE